MTAKCRYRIIRWFYHPEDWSCEVDEFVVTGYQKMLWWKGILLSESRLGIICCYQISNLR